MTDLPSQPTIELMLQTTIPRVLDVTPLVLYWKQGEKLAPKTAEIDLAPICRFKSWKSADAGPNFQVALKEIQHAAHYELVVDAASSEIRTRNAPGRQRDNSGHRRPHRARANHPDLAT